MSKKLVLVDGSNQAYRAYHAIQNEMTAPDGFPTKAIYGLIRILISIVKEHNPDYVLVVFDKGKSFRAEKFSEYKAHRPSMPDPLKKQWPELIPISEVFGFRTYAEDDGYEADDVIGTMAKKYGSSDIHVTIISNDKDFAQLVDENISLYNPSKKETYDVAGIIKKWNVRPNQIVDYLAMVGDKSDNIPGIPGIGKKTAEKILADHHGFDDIYQNLDSIRQKKKFVASKDSFVLSRDLITIHKDVPISFSLEDCVVKSYDPDTLITHMSRFGFFRLIEDLGHTPKSMIPAYKMAKEESFLETSKANTGLSLALYQHDALFYLGIANDNQQVLATEVSSISPAVFQLLETSISWTVHDYKSFLPFVEKGMLPKPQHFVDIMLNSHLSDVSIRPHLDILALRKLNHKMSKKPVVEAKTLFDLADDTPIYEYVSEQAMIVQNLKDKIPVNVSQKLVDLEYAVLPILYQLEKRGVQLDVDILKQISKELAIELEKIEEEIYQQAGTKFNINSPKQVGKILFEDKGFKPLKKNKTGLSTNAQTLALLLEETDDPLIRNLIIYRELSKLKGTYVDPLSNYVDDSGRIHTRLHQTITETGRLSSSDPNLQNIPIRTERGRKIRRAFVAKEGMRLISADYSQLELRILAHFCESGGLVDAFSKDVDIHEQTGRDIAGSDEDYTPAHRAAAKAINYGLMYGMGAFRLAKELRISFAEATSYIDRYFEKYPQVRVYMDTQIEYAKEKGYVETLLGRRRKVSNINDRIRHIREGAERIAMNTPIQGTAADIVKVAMVQVEKKLQEQFPETKLLLQIHDELLIEVPSEKVDDVANLIRTTMEKAVSLIVPLKVHIGIGDNWAQVH